MNYKTGLIIGRFQPFHFGHLYLLKKGLEICDKIIIGIGSASIFDENNLLSYEERKKMIKKVIKNENLTIEKIVDLEDFFDDEKWLENVKNKVGQFDIVIGNNEWTNKIMEKAGYQTKRFPYYKRFLYEGWRIRKLIKQKKSWQDRVPKYLINDCQVLSSRIIFNKIVLGGTFDHFHKGHQEFLKTAFLNGKEVIIGITTDDFIKNKSLTAALESFSERKNSVVNFLEKKDWQKRAKIIAIDDFIGGVDKMKDVEAIVVSKNTYLNALKINDLREKNHLKKMRIIIAKDVLTDDGELISSEKIRSGEIDRSGKSYLNFLKRFNKEELILPDNLREKLRKPLGLVFKDTFSLINYLEKRKLTMIIAVGDIIAKELLKEKINPEIKIIDFKTRRTIISQKLRIKLNQINFKMINKPGTISIKAAEKLKELIISVLSSSRKRESKNFFIIDGEEDLLALPAILFAPLKSLVVYGHFQYGIIGVEVTEKIKNKIKLLLKNLR